MNIKRIITPLLIIFLLLSIVVMGAPNYGNVGPTTELGFDIKIEDEIVAEGSSADEHETTIDFTDPTADRTITIPDSDQTVGTATSILDNSILEVDLKAVDESADEDILTKEDTTGDFEWHSAAEIKALMNLDLVANLKVKLDATGAPTVNNDVDEGYTVGSRWLDVTNDKEYVCLDNTDGAAVWTETTQSGGGGAFTDLTDTPANYTGSSLKHVRVNVGETALEFVTLGGGGDMLKATYDTDDDGDIDVAAGGTEKSVWTLYAIPYLSGTTTFGEIAIGTAEYCLTVNATATGYDYTELAFLANIVEDTTPQLGGQLQAGAHSINFTEQVLTSGTAIAWNLGNSNKATLAAAHNFTITITDPSGALNAQLIITQDGTGSRIMDEVVTQKDEAIATTDVHADTEIIDLTVDIPTGARIRFKTSAADLPDPLVVDTIYWAIRTSENHIKVSTTKANAIAGTAIDITDQGTGTHTVQQLVKWTGGTLGVLSTAAGSEDILSLTYKTADKQWYAQLAKDFQ